MTKTLISSFLFSLALLSSSTAAEDRRMYIANNYKSSIVELYASPINQKSWTYNMLESKTIKPNTSMLADIDDGTGFCRYDLHAVMSDGAEATKYNVNVCKVTKWVIN